MPRTAGIAPSSACRISPKSKDLTDADVNGDGSLTTADRTLVNRGRNLTLALQLPLSD